MKFFIKLILVSLIAFFMQISFLSNLAEFGIYIDLLFICMSFYVIFFEIRKYFWSIIFLGVLHDLISLHHFGLYILLYFLISMFISLFKKRIDQYTVVNQVVIVFFSFIFFKFLSILPMCIFDFKHCIGIIPYKRISLELLYTVLFTPLFFLVLKKTHKL